MSLSPQVLLGSIARERCITNLKSLPWIIPKKIKHKAAAVLVPLCVDNGEVCLLYTLRSSSLKHHSGQVSFPGGMTEPNETAYEAALRETEEEIDVNRDSVDLWGEMPPVLGRNKEIHITPIVGLVKNFDIKKLTPNLNEVNEIFTVPMKVFCDKERHGCFKYEKYSLPVYLTEKHIVWGITALITHLFLQTFLPQNVYEFDITKKQFTFEELMRSKL